MAYKTIYTCDKCGNEQDTSVQFWTIGISANPHLRPSPCFVEKMSMQVCRKCLESFGVHIRSTPDKQEPINAIPTLEEAIIDIVRRCTEMNKEVQ